MKLIREYIEFERGKDPKKAMGIGKFYDLWREEHTKKIIVQVLFFLTDPMGNKKRYTVFLNYEANWDNYSDSVWWGRGRLIGGWEGSGTQFSVSNMQNKPEDFFYGTADERTMWENPEPFNKLMIDPLSEGKVKKAITDLMEDWWEGDFETQLRDWFKSGVMTVHRVEYKAL
jgi:hypothetical protein